MPEENGDHRYLPARYPRYPEARYPAPQREVPGYPGEDDDAIHLRDYWRVLVSRRWTVLAALLTVLTVTAIATFKQVPIYQASTQIQIDRENPNILSFQDVYEIESMADDALQTQYQILSSRTLARRVVEDLRLERHPEFQPDEPSVLDALIDPVVDFFATGEGRSVASKESEELRRVVDTYLDRLTVTPVRLARLVNVSFSSEDPTFAAEVINAHARHFIDQNLQFRFDATQEASRFLSVEVDRLQANLERAEDELLGYSVANDILFTEEGRNTAMDKLQQLEEQFTDAQGERFQKESYQRLIEAGSTDALPQVRNNILISDLSARLIDLQRQEADLAVTFAPEWPGRQRLRRQIEGIEQSIEREEQRIVATAEAEYLAAVQREELLRTAVSDQVEVVNEVNQQMVQYGILRREADSMKNLYDGLLTRLQEAGVSGTLSASNIRIVDRAEPPDSPVRPRKALNLALGLLAGLTIGIGMAFFQDHMDNSIKSPDDVTRYLRVPTIGAVPRRDALRGRDHDGAYGTYGHHSAKGSTLPLQPDSPIELISFNAPNSVMAEAYRSMRTSLLLSSADHPPKTVLVTSAMPSEGKTVTAVNMAVSLAQTGSRVALVDADMRKPRVHSVFALGATPGLSAVLTGSAGIREVLHDVSVPNLFVLPCGVVPPNPAELLMSKRFQQTLIALREYFDFVVVDSPPLANVSDARILARLIDSTLVVVKAWATPRAAAEHAVAGLLNSHGRVSGVVLNDIDMHVKGYDAYYSGQYYATKS